MLKSIDIAIFKFFNAFHTPWWDALMVFGSDLGLYKGWIVCSPLIIALAVWQQRQNPSMPRHNLLPFAMALAAVAAGYGLAIPMVEWLKDYFNTPRPYALLPAGEVVRVDTQLNHASAARSFPSGHSAVAATIMFSFGLLPWVWVRRAALFVGVWIAVSRLSLGVHFPVDVIGGLIIGASCCVLAAELMQSIWKKIVNV